MACARFAPTGSARGCCASRERQLCGRQRRPGDDDASPGAGEAAREAGLLTVRYTSAAGLRGALAGHGLLTKSGR
jgi:hypothetical protein